MFTDKNVDWVLEPSTMKNKHKQKDMTDSNLVQDIGLFVKPEAQIIDKKTNRIHKK